MKTLTVNLASYHLERDRMALDNNINHIEALTRTNEHIEKVSSRINFLETKRNILNNTNLNAGEVTVTLNKFFPIWDTLSLSEQNRILDKLFDRILWDGKSENLDFHYSPIGIKLLEKQTTEKHDDHITVS